MTITYYLYIDEICDKVLESEDPDLDILCIHCGMDLVQKGKKRRKIEL